MSSLLTYRSDRTTRTRALSALRTYLSQTKTLTLPECLKLWKGLYYCLWLQDKPRNQQQLARDLADLLHVLKADTFIIFATAFWQTMAREWGGIDALRMDKYLYLVRCYVQEGFQYVRRKGWKEELLEEYLEVLEGVAFNVRDPKIPNGLRYHVIDLYVDELDKTDVEDEAPVEKVLEPMRKLGKESLTKTVRKRVAEALDDDRLANWKGRREIAEEEEEDEEENEEREANGATDGAANGDDEFGGFDD